MKSCLFTLTVLFCYHLNIIGQGEPFQAALSAYNSADYQKSIEILEELSAKGEISEELYYNLGLSYMKSDQLSWAIANFHKVLLLDPNHEEAQSALELAKGKITTPITEIPDFILYDLFVRAAESMSINGWSLIQIVFLLVVLVLLYYFLFSSTAKRVFGYSAILIFFLALWSYYNAQYLKDRSDNPDLIVVINENTEIYTAADDRSEVVTIVGEGVTAKSRDKLTNWVKIELADKDVGWVQKEKVIIVQ